MITRQLNLFTAPRQPLVVAYGVGVDSTAVLVEFVRRGIRPDVILHADVGAEKPETVHYIPIMNAYLAAHGFPTVTVVRYIPKKFKHWPPYYSLEENCLTNGTLPSISFNFRFKSCSQKWKAAPQHAYLKAWRPAVERWASGGKVKKVIGYDAGVKDKKRVTYACNAEMHADLYEYWYPLPEWGWDRERCMAEIAAAGLPVPPKSSCFMCAAMHPEEIEALGIDQLRRIVRLEARARPRFKSIKGLWGAGSKKRSGSMTEYIRAKGLLPAAEIDTIIAQTPGEILDYQACFQRGESVEPFGDFIEQQLIQIEGMPLAA